MIHSATLARTIALLCLSCFASAALAQSAAQGVDVRKPAAAVSLNPQPLPPKELSRAVRRDPATGKAIIIVSGRDRKASRKIKRSHPGGPVMLNPQPLPPKALSAH